MIKLLETLPNWANAYEIFSLKHKSDFDVAAAREKTLNALIKIEQIPEIELHQAVIAFRYKYCSSDDIPIKDIGDDNRPLCQYDQNKVNALFVFFRFLFNIKNDDIESVLFSDRYSARPEYSRLSGKPFPQTWPVFFNDKKSTVTIDQFMIVNHYYLQDEYEFLKKKYSFRKASYVERFHFQLA